MLEAILENKIINNLAGNFRRSPLQKNQLHESDSEIIEFSENSGEYIAITIDSITEEIETKLYDDPYLIGWMTVMVNISDLSAVGAEPIGLVISEILPEAFSDELCEKMQKGIKEAADYCKTFVLGGDTNYGPRLSLTGCALGRVPKNKVIKRTGCKAGDILYSTGRLGRGNAYALIKLFKIHADNFHYLPYAKLSQAKIIRKYASACIDTSDGTIIALDQLMRLNNLGFYINRNSESILDRESTEIIKARGISPWLLLAGEHGEFELLFTIPSKNENDFLKTAGEENWEPIRLGIVVQETAIILNLYGKNTAVDSGRIRNLSFHAEENTEMYLNELLEYDKELAG